MNTPHTMVFALMLITGASVPSIGCQSLAEAARKEAERRKALQSEGIQGKVIDGNDASNLAPAGNISTSSPSVSSAGRVTKRPDPAPSRRSLPSYRGELQKMDRQIRQTEERLTQLRSRVQTERWTPYRSAKSLKSATSSTSLDRLKQQVQEQEAKLKRLRQERMETYDSARRAGYLPGEVDGKGIIP